MLAFVIAAVIILIAGIAQSATGFGFALVAVPLLLFVLDPKSVVALAVTLSTIVSIMRIVNLRKHVDWRRVIIICIGSAFGIPPGVYILSNLNPAVIKIVIAGVIIPFSLALLFGLSYRFKRDDLGNGVSGFISGALTASTSLGGPPVVMYLLGRNLGKKEFVGTITALILITVPVTMGAHLLTGALTADLLKYAVVFVPVLILGFYVGNKILHAISPNLFKRVSSLIILLSALAIIVTTLGLV